MTAQHSLIFTLVLTCSLTTATQRSISPLKAFASLGLGAALLYNFRNEYLNTKDREKLLAHTAGALASGYLLGGLFQKDSSFTLGDVVASGVLGGSIIAYRGSYKKYPKLWTTASACGFGVMLKKLIESSNSQEEPATDVNEQAPSVLD